MKPSIGTTSEGKTIPIDVERLIETRLVLTAISGGGKSHAIRRILEQTHDKVQHIVIDPEGEFYTLREKFPYVLAGKNGDCPADVRSAALLAIRLLELRVSAILDIYDLPPQQRVVFVKLFLDSLLNAPKGLLHPCIVVIDEAHVFAPEKGEGDAVSRNSVVTLMAQGRKKLLCPILATQRLSKLDKSAISEAHNMMIGKSILDIDVTRGMKYLGFHKGNDGYIRKLQRGHFWTFGPAFCDEVMDVLVDDTITKTPKLGPKAPAPPPPKESVKRILATLADLPHEAEQEAQTVGDLKRKIRELETAAKARPVNPEPESIKVIESHIRQEYEKYFFNLQASAKRAAEMISGVWATTEKARIALDEIGNATLPVVTDTRFDSRRIAVPPRVAPVESNGNHASFATLSKGERTILTSVAQHAQGVTREQIAVLTGYKSTSRYEYLRKLQAAGLIDQGGDLITATDSGIAALGNDYAPLPTGDALREYWLPRLSEGERKILEIAIAAHPGNPVDRAELQEGTGYKSTSIYEYTRKLLARKLLVSSGPGKVRASEELFS